MKLYLYIIFAIIFAIVQASFLSSFSFFGASPRLVLSALIAMCLLKKQKEAIYFVIIAGIILDVYASTLFGISALIFLLIYFLTSLLLDKVFTETGTMTNFFLSVAATLFFFIVSIAVSYLTKLLGVTVLVPSFFGSLILHIIVSSIFNSALVFLLYSFFKIFDELFEKKAYRRKISF